MDHIGRSRYHKAASQILRAARFNVQEVKTCQFTASRQTLNLFIDVAGKKLPYPGSRGESAFPWETHIKRDRLDRLDRAASRLQASPYMAYCYCILEHDFRSHFPSITTVDAYTFGLKLISTSDFRQHMQSRSPHSWDAVELPRADVLTLLSDPTTF